MYRLIGQSDDVSKLKTTLFCPSQTTILRKIPQAKYMDEGFYLFWDNFLA